LALKQLAQPETLAVAHLELWLVSHSFPLSVKLPFRRCEAVAKGPVVPQLQDGLASCKPTQIVLADKPEDCEVRVSREFGNEPLLTKRDKPVDILRGIIDKIRGKTDKRRGFAVSGGEFEGKWPRLEPRVLQGGKGGPEQGGDTVSISNFRFRTCRGEQGCSRRTTLTEPVWKGTKKLVQCSANCLVS